MKNEFILIVTLCLASFGVFGQIDGTVQIVSGRDNTPMRHYGGNIIRAHPQNELQRWDSGFKIVEGLAGDGSVSIISVNWPGVYLSNVKGNAEMAKFKDTELFKRNASWYLKPGLAHNDWYSFQSHKHPDHYLVFRGENILLEKLSNLPTKSVRWAGTFQLFKYSNELKGEPMTRSKYRAKIAAEKAAADRKKERSLRVRIWIDTKKQEPSSCGANPVYIVNNTDKGTSVTYTITGQKFTFDEQYGQKRCKQVTLTESIYVPANGQTRIGYNKAGCKSSAYSSGGCDPVYYRIKN